MDRTGQWGCVIVLCLLFIILRVSVTTFTETTLGLNSNYQLSDWSFSRLAAPVSMVATFFSSISLFTTRLLRRTGLFVAVLSGILFIFEHRGRLSSVCFRISLAHVRARVVPAKGRVYRFSATFVALIRARSWMRLRRRHHYMENVRRLLNYVKGLRITHCAF